MAVKRVLLDTSAYSYLMRGSSIVADLLNDADDVLLCSVVVGELLSGFKKGENEKRNKIILNDFLTVSNVSLVSIDDVTAERYAVILDYLRRQGTPIPTNDLWIAACAMQHGLTLITGDRHFTLVPHVIVETVTS
jgi:tRNA(fMet)-specific endonuclease VapC